MLSHQDICTVVSRWGIEMRKTRFLKMRRDVTHDQVLTWFVIGEACIGRHTTEEYATVVILNKWIGCLIAQKGQG